MKFRTYHFEKGYHENEDPFYARQAKCVFDFDGCDGSISMTFIPDDEGSYRIDTYFNFANRTGQCFWEIERYHESFYDYAKSCGIPSSVALLYGNLIDGFVECEDLDNVVYYIFPWAKYDEHFFA